jgi:hypothetical protein
MGYHRGHFVAVRRFQTKEVHSKRPFEGPEMSERGRFETLVMAAQHSPKRWRDAVVAVADSAFMCRAWLEDHAPGWTPADLIAMTRLVMERENTGITPENTA